MNLHGGWFSDLVCCLGIAVLVCFVLFCWDRTLGGRKIVASKPDLVGSRGSQLLVSDLVADCWVQIFVGVLSSS